MATKIGQMAQEMAATNPWWRDPERWHIADRDLRAAEAEGITYTPPVLDALQPGSMYLLRGPRRVGKTVAVKRKIRQLIDHGVHPHTIVRAAVDGWNAKDVRTLVHNVALPPHPAGQTRWWFLDEISATKGDWDAHIKWLRDNIPEFNDACVVLTGSKAAELTRASGTLAGRRGAATDVDRTLLPMGFATFMRLRADLPDLQLPLDQLHTDAGAQMYAQLLPWLNDLTRGWDLYLQYGGFPSAVAAAGRGEPIPEAFLQAMMDVIARDAFATSRLSRTQTTTLLERLWQSMATPANLSNIAQDLDTSSDTVARHVDYLGDAYLAWRCPQRQDKAWRPRLRAQDKIYAIDPLVARLTHLRNPARADIDPTVLTEMLLGVALHRASMRSGRLWADDEHLFYVRTPARKEIDFVSADLGGVAVEGKYTEGRWRSEAATVNASEYDGVLVTRNVLDTADNAAWAVPTGILAYLIDT